MKWSELVAAMALASVVSSLSAAVGQADGKRHAPRRDKPASRPLHDEVSAAEQSAWIDENLPTLLAAMAASPVVRGKIASSLPLERARSSFPLTPQADGLAPGGLERSSNLVHAAVASNPRYRQSARAKPPPAVTVMPDSRIVRVEMTYPAPPASKDLEPGPLTIDAWVCPDRQTALALYWLRRWGGNFLVPSPPGDLVKSVVAAPDFGTVKAAEKDLGESSYRLSPATLNAAPLTKADVPIPAERLSFLRGNVVVEASTLEFVLIEEEKKWLVLSLRQCAPDVVAIMRSIDAGLVRFEEPRPGLLEVSAAEQSAWLDQSIPKMMAAMRASKEVRAKVAGPLAVEKVAPFPLTPAAAGLAPGDLERWTALADAAVAANPRYSRGGKNKPRPTVTVMPHTEIVRVEATYPAPPASKDLEAGALTIDAWVCPDRATAIALFWLRRNGFRLLDDTSPEAVTRSILSIREDAIGSKAGDGLPGEVASWDYPKVMISAMVTKGREHIPADRLLFLRGNVVVEASTVEFVWNEGVKKWVAAEPDESAPDIVAVMRAIDAGLVRLAKPPEPRSK
jgi:hypothetical protein